MNQDLRLENRFIDLRTPANNAIFKVQVWQTHNTPFSTLTHPHLSLSLTHSL